MRGWQMKATPFLMGFLIVFEPIDSWKQWHFRFKGEQKKRYDHNQIMIIPF